MTVVKSANRIAHTIELSPEENETLQRISAVEYLPESVLLRKLVLEGLDRYRLDYAINAYTRGETDLSGAARYAGISVEQMMREMEARGVYINSSVEKFLDGVESLLDMFGGDEAVYRVLAEMRRREGLEPGEASTPTPPTPHRHATAIDENQTPMP